MNTRQRITVAILSLSAAALLVANFQLDKTAQAQQAIIGRDYSLVTAPVVRGDDGLYVLDNRTGMIALFTWDTRTRGVTVSDVRLLDDLMAGENR